MENKWIILILFFAIFININYHCYASENIITDIDLEAEINEDASIVITEIIRGDFYLGTELYKSYDDLVINDINNFSVIENGIEFKNIEGWNIAENRENKNYKSSIIQNPDGIELVWGIGAPGKHEYKLKYTINGVLQNSEMSLKVIDLCSLCPQRAKITIKGKINQDTFIKINDEIKKPTKENEKVTYDIENISKDISIYLNYNGIDNSSKKVKIIKIKSNDKTKVLKILKILIILFVFVFIIIVIILVGLNKKERKYVFKPF